MVDLPSRQLKPHLGILPGKREAIRKVYGFEQLILSASKKVGNRALAKLRYPKASDALRKLRLNSVLCQHISQLSSHKPVLTRFVDRLRIALGLRFGCLHHLCNARRIGSAVGQSLSDRHRIDVCKHILCRYGWLVHWKRDGHRCLSRLCCWFCIAETIILPAEPRVV